jgi:hypothetical protein
VNRSQATDEADKQDEQRQREQSEGAWVPVRGCPQGLREEALPELPFVILGRQRDLIPVQPVRPAGRRELGRVSGARRAALRQITLREAANSTHPGTEATFGREAGIVGRRQFPTSRGLASWSAGVGRSGAARALAVALAASAAAAWFIVAAAGFIVVVATAAAFIAAAFIAAAFIAATATATAVVIAAVVVIAAAATAAAFIAATATAAAVVIAAVVVIAAAATAAAFIAAAATAAAVVIAAFVVLLVFLVFLVFLVPFVLVRIFGRLRDRSTRSDGRQRRWTGRRKGESEKEKKDPEPHLSWTCPRRSGGRDDHTWVPDKALASCSTPRVPCTWKGFPAMDSVRGRRPRQERSIDPGQDKAVAAAARC